MEKINDRPQVSAFFNINLEKIAQVVERRAGFSQLPLLFDRGRLGVALRYQDASQSIAKLAWHFLIGGHAAVITETNFRVSARWLKKYPPTVVRHFHIIEIRPTTRLDADRCAQIDLFGLKTFRTHLMPPINKVGQPMLQRALQLLILIEVYVVRNASEVHNLFLSHYYRSYPSAKQTLRQKPNRIKPQKHPRPQEK